MAAYVENAKKIKYPNKSTVKHKKAWTVKSTLNHKLLLLMSHENLKYI